MHDYSITLIRGKSMGGKLRAKTEKISRFSDYLSGRRIFLVLEMAVAVAFMFFNYDAVLHASRGFSDVAYMPARGFGILLLLSGLLEMPETFGREIPHQNRAARRRLKNHVAGTVP